MNMRYDALLLVSFGGPETRDDVLPFLENVLRGRNVPQARMREVAEHYYHFGGKSPINDQNRLLLSKIRETLQERGPATACVLGKPKLAPVSQGRDLADARGRDSQCLGIRDLGIQFVLGMPAVSGRHSASP